MVHPVNLSINLACLFVSLYLINVKTAKPTGTKFCVGPHMTPRKVYRWSKFQKLASNKNRFLINFENPQHFSFKSAKFTFIIVIQCIKRENFVHNQNRRGRPESLVNLKVPRVRPNLRFLDPPPPSINFLHDH